MKQTILEGVSRAPTYRLHGFLAYCPGTMMPGLSSSMIFAKWVGAEAVLYFTSGYAANIGLLSAVLQPEDIVFFG